MLLVFKDCLNLLWNRIHSAFVGLICNASQCFLTQTLSKKSSFSFWKSDVMVVGQWKQLPKVHTQTENLGLLLCKAATVPRGASRCPHYCKTYSAIPPQMLDTIYMPLWETHAEYLFFSITQLRKKTFLAVAQVELSMCSCAQFWTLQENRGKREVRGKQ